MILSIKQTRAEFTYNEWNVISANSDDSANAKSEFTRDERIIDISYNDGKCQRLSFKPTVGNGLKDALSFKLLVSGEQVGSLVGQTKKVKGFLQSYEYSEFKVGEDIYYGYEVATKNGGICFCIYKGDEVISIVQKSMKVVDCQDQYTAYLEKDSYMSVVVPFVIYYDITKYGDVLMNGEHSVKQVVTPKIFSKELLSKYDADFIGRVINNL